jgi:antitoxin component YwqK of YwqJK toxin-antitoxin module
VKTPASTRYIITRWHTNGQLSYTASYHLGKLHGLQQRWHANGQLAYSTTYHIGTPMP